MPSDSPGFNARRKSLASLNHPNIAAIHGLEGADGVTALVMELVEGTTLAERIARGPIPLDEALPIAKQIADALEAAHEQGIIHRDLKPANIKVRPDGTVKVWTSGWRRRSEPTAERRPLALSNSPTITSPAGMTGVGVLSAPRPIWRRSKHVESRWTSARTSGRLARCCTRC